MGHVGNGCDHFFGPETYCSPPVTPGGSAFAVKPSLKSVSAVTATVIATSYIGPADNCYAAAIRGDGADTTAGAANHCDALDVRTW